MILTMIYKAVSNTGVSKFTGKLCEASAFSDSEYQGYYICCNPVSVINSTCQESEEDFCRSTLRYFGRVVLFLYIVYSLLVQEVCGHPCFGPCSSILILRNLHSPPALEFEPLNNLADVSITNAKSGGKCSVRLTMRLSRLSFWELNIVSGLPASGLCCAIHRAR